VELRVKRIFGHRVGQMRTACDTGGVAANACENQAHD